MIIVEPEALICFGFLMSGLLQTQNSPELISFNSGLLNILELEIYVKFQQMEFPEFYLLPKPHHS